MINYDLKCLTCDETVHVKGNDFTSFKYETKKRVDETIYDSGKRNYCERRGGYWRAPHPRQLRKLESKLRDKTIITCEWTGDSLLTIVFSSGVIAYLTVKQNSLDITQILFDRYFVGKLSGQTVTNVALCKTHMLLTHTERMATLVTFSKNNISLPCRISDRDPHIQCIELGGSNRRTERHISSNESSNGMKILVWSVTIAEPAPWSPIVEDHANLHLYSIHGQSVSLKAYHQLENETLSAELAYKGDGVIHIVEQVNYHKNGVSLDWLRYEMSSDIRDRPIKMSSARESATRVSLSVPVRLVRRSPCDTRLLVACIDSSLHVVHSIAGLTHTTRAGFIATEIRWADDLIIAAEEGGKLQCFDRALSLLHYHSKCLDLTSYLRDAKRMQLLATKTSKSGPMIFATFLGGPLALLHITHPRLLTAWIRVRRTSNAVALLRAMDWEREGTECLWAVNKLVCAALRGKSEGEQLVAQAALGAYLAPRAPLPAAARRYAPPLHDLARKYFHHLLRRGRVEKALSLAVDLAAWDLFADARWAASRQGLQHLADEAASLASHYSQQDTHDSECSESCTDCSSYTGSEDGTSASSEAVKTKPPPLPRVSLPNHGTLMQVPMTQTEPISTNSIRPNLHQYLERDNTIWTKDLRDDTYVKPETYDREHPKSILNMQNCRWHSMDVLSNYKTQKHSLLTINEGTVKPTHALVDIIPRTEERTNSTHFIYQKELREDAPNTLYRYQNNNTYHPSTSMKDRMFRNDTIPINTEKHSNRAGEKNKVKFSDTVTIAVVSDPMLCPEPSRELADSLPLCAPHKYLSAFTPHASHAAGAHAAPAGTTLDYVEV